MLKTISTEEHFINRKPNLEALIANGKYIGNVLFTDEGVVVVKPYNVDYRIDCEENAQEQDTLLLQDLHELIKQRMHHCVEELNEHINDKDVFIYPKEIIWVNGHFNTEVYKIMNNFQTYAILNFTDLNSLFGIGNMHCIYQQAIRHLYWCLQNEIVINGLNYNQDDLFRRITDLIVY